MPFRQKPGTRAVGMMAEHEGITLENTYTGKGTSWVNSLCESAAVSKRTDTLLAHVRRSTTKYSII